jgi:hypothetical protein
MMLQDVTSPVSMAAIVALFTEWLMPASSEWMIRDLAAGADGS